MARLIAYTRLGGSLENSVIAPFVCSFADAIRFAHRLGEVILIADISPSLAGGYVGIGTLLGFRNMQADGSFALIGDIQLFPADIEFQHTPPQIEGLDEIDDETFERIASLAPQRIEAHEAAGLWGVDHSQDEFSAQLARQQRRYCSFSGTKTYKGAAFAIRPQEQGGTNDISNRIFVDPEPGALFAAFAWTIGPRLELIIDAYAMSADIADTVNRTGMLAISDTALTTLDRDALAWHREQFFARRRG